MTFNKSKSRLSLFLSIFALLVPVMATAQNASDVQVSLVGVHTQTQAKSKTNQASLILKKELRKKLQHAGLRIKANFSVQLSPSTEQDDTAKTTRFQKTIEQANEVYTEGNLEHALPLYIEAIELLASLNRPTQEQIEALSHLRLQTANKLLVSENLADKATPLLRAALKANPLLELDAAQYPQKLRKHFARIRSAWAQEPKNNFLIRSQPEQAVVFMEGQSLGLTPLHLLNYVSEGTYRLWLQKDNVRTTTRWITVDDKPVSINFDFQTQYYFDAVKQVFHLQPATINLHEFTQNLQASALSRPLLLTGLLEHDTSWDVFTLWIDDNDCGLIRSRITTLENTELLRVAQSHANAVMARQWQPLEATNFFNPKLTSPKSNPNEEWKTWTLLGASAVILGATITSALLLWPTTAEEGQLKVSVVP